MAKTSKHQEAFAHEPFKGGAAFQATSVPVAGLQRFFSPRTLRPTKPRSRSYVVRVPTQALAGRLRILAHEM